MSAESMLMQAESDLEASETKCADLAIALAKMTGERDAMAAKCDAAEAREQAALGRIEAALAKAAAHEAAEAKADALREQAEKRSEMLVQRIDGLVMAISALERKEQPALLRPAGAHRIQITGRDRTGAVSEVSVFGIDEATH